MNYGLYLSAGGALTSMHRQDVIANNMANINTIGFKPDAVSLRHRLPERLEGVGASADVDPHWLLEQLGGGTFAHATRIHLAQGAISETGNDLDLALDGEGFFVVSGGSSGRSSSGGSGAANPARASTTGPANGNIRFTRDGRFTLNQAGELVLAASGMRVLDVNDQPIRLNRATEVRIDGEGNVRQNQAIVAKLQVSAPPADASALAKQGGNLLRLESGGGPARRQPAAATIRQGCVELSAVDPILTLNEMINASKTVQANITMMQYHDNVMGQAINTFGRVG